MNDGANDAVSQQLSCWIPRRLYFSSPLGSLLSKPSNKRRAAIQRLQRQQKMTTSDIPSTSKLRMQVCVQIPAAARYSQASPRRFICSPRNSILG